MRALTSYEEKALLKKISAGHEKAFRVLYDTYFDRLSLFVFKLCKSNTLTEEIVQDIFLKLWINRSDLLNIDSPGPYIFSMARNKTIDHLRRLIREAGLRQELAHQMATSKNEIEENLNAAELKSLIEKALTRLSAQKKTVFHLSRQEGLSHDEIAARLHLSKSTVKNHLSETLKLVRDQLDHRPNTEALWLLLIFLSLH